MMTREEALQRAIEHAEQCDRYDDPAHLATTVQIAQAWAAIAALLPQQPPKHYGGWDTMLGWQIHGDTPPTRNQYMQARAIRERWAENPADFRPRAEVEALHDLLDAYEGAQQAQAEWLAPDARESSAEVE